MDFKHIVASRHAAKAFDSDRKIRPEHVEELLEIVRLAPSSFNLQPWKIMVITDPALKQRLAPAAWNQPQIMSSSHLLVFLADTRLDHLIAQLAEQMDAVGVHPDRRDPYVSMMYGFSNRLSPEEKKAWSQRQVYLALGNALNGAESLGFDSCPMEGFDPAAFSQILALPSHLVPTVLCPIGYAVDSPSAKMRFSKKQIVLTPADLSSPVPVVA